MDRMTEGEMEVPFQFVVSESCHRMPCIQGHDLAPEILRIVRAAVTCNLMDDERYQARWRAGAFLQGYEERHGWILVEFWQSNYQPFVDLVNRLIADEKQIKLFRELIDAGL